MNDIWHARVDERDGNTAFVTLYQEGQADLLAEVDLARWHLDGVEPGDILILNTHSQTVTKMDLGTWTQEKIDDIRKRAKERHAMFMGISD